MSAPILMNMKDYVGNAPTWDGKVESLPQATEDWKTWSIRKRFYEEMLEVERTEGRKAQRGKSS